ncbi:MAG: class I SAM-dependent methyltransferase [Nanoarchaeota archaeon]|nr:class I SAM-dependent methyltransferase [Nanoarchaeota archaeon]MBU1632712.1 class I SAM-dependent methyltransferase [Nanoarchaeota archaeon]MBU1875600.1 class I SAM-dependent methyltransferase [Nanoarchaeota archaeon]
MNKNKYEQQHMEKSWKRGGTGGYRTFEVDDSVIKFNQFLKEKKVKGKLLDIGCGNGKNTLYFSKNGFDVLGIDFTLSAIKISKDYAKKENSKAKFKVVDIVEDELKEDNYDIIIDCGCLHHLRKQYWNKYRRNILRSLKSGGYYYLHAFSDNNYKLGHNKQYRLRKGHYTNFLSEKEIKTAFGKYFKIIKTYEFLTPNKRFIVRAYYMKRD